MEHDEIIQLLQAYGADPDVLSEYHCWPLRVRIVRSVVKLRTPVGTWALKKVYMPESRLEHIYQVTEHIARAGTLTVPRFIKSRYGDPYVVHPSGLYYMTAWISGREADLRKENHLLEGAGLLARWHRAAAGFHSPGDWDGQAESMIERLQGGKTAFKLAYDRARQTAHPSPFERLLLASAEELNERINYAESRFQKAGLAKLEDHARRLGLLCHGNFTKKNILHDGEAYTVVNYDSVHPGPPLYDFALFIHRYLPSYDWNEDILESVVAAYETEYGYQPEQRFQLSALLGAPFRPLQVIAWYLNKTVDWAEEDFVDALELALELEEAREYAAEQIRADEQIASSAQGSTIEWASTPGDMENQQLQLLATDTAEQPTTETGRMNRRPDDEQRTTRSQKALHKSKRRVRKSPEESNPRSKARQGGPIILGPAVRPKDDEEKQLKDEMSDGVQDVIKDI